MLATAKIDINQLVQMEVPPLPGAALRVANLTQDLDASARSIANAIGMDPILSARILRAANSAFYALEKRVSALPIAVNTLGNNAIYTIVMMYTVSDSFGARGPHSAIQRTLWEHSVAVGLGSREIARVLGFRGEEEAFLCGLLHDIGKLMLIRHDGDLYTAVMRVSSEEDLLDAETEAFGYTHAQVGALVARKWDLPDEISYAIYNHHRPSEAGQSHLMARVVDVADELANAAGIGLRGDTTIDVSELAEKESIIALRLTDTQLRETWVKTERSLCEMIALLD